MGELETERLILRPYRADDLPRMAAMYGDPEVTAYTKLGRQTPSQAAAILEGYLQDWRAHGFGMSALLLKPDRPYVGESGLFLLSDGEAALRYALLRPFWGRGLTAEAVRATLDDAFHRTGRVRILSVVQASNAASLGVMRKLGIEVARTGRDGDEVLLIHEVTREAWLRQAPSS